MTQMKPHIRITDAWKAGTLDRARMLAYKLMINAEVIRLADKINVIGSDAVITYLSIAPAEWTHDLLKTTYERIKNGEIKEEDITI